MLSFRLTLSAVGLLLTLGAPLQAKTIAGPWSPTEGLRQFTRITGRPVVDPANLSGWCTWFVHAVAPFDLPRGAACSYYPQMRSDALDHPIPGSVVVWSGAMGRGYGHVGFVTDVDVEPGTFDVWDANFSVGWDRRIRWRRTATNDSRILGFICPPRFREPAEELVQPVLSDYDLAFVRDGNLFLYHFDDRRVRPLTRGGGVSHPSWTPDGADLVFSQRGRIRKLELATGELTTLSTSATCFQPAVRDDGQIWFVRLLPDERGNPKRADLWSMDLDGEHASRLGMVCERPLDAGIAPRLIGRTHWTDDGRAIVEVWEASGPVAFDHAGLRIGELDEAPEEPTKVKFGPVRNTGPAAWLGHAISKAADQLAGEGELGGWPAPSPDGEELLLAADGFDEDGPAVRIVGYNVDAGVVYDVLQDATQPAWSPTFGGLTKVVAVSSSMTVEPPIGTIPDE